MSDAKLHSAWGGWYCRWTPHHRSPKPIRCAGISFNGFSEALMQKWVCSPLCLYGFVDAGQFLIDDPGRPILMWPPPSVAHLTIRKTHIFSVGSKVALGWSCTLCCQNWVYWLWHIALLFRNWGQCPTHQGSTISLLFIPGYFSNFMNFPNVTKH